MESPPDRSVKGAGALPLAWFQPLCARYGERKGGAFRDRCRFVNEPKRTSDGTLTAALWEDAAGLSPAAGSRLALQKVRGAGEPRSRAVHEQR